MSDPVLEARSISHHRNGRILLKDISIDLHKGELVGLLGPNGVGKSTLLDILAGHLEPTDGEVHIDGKSLESWNRRSLAQTMSYMPQGHACHWPISVERMVSLGRFPSLQAWEKPREEDEKAILLAMQKADVIHLRERKVTQLSGGEQARVALARTLAVGADIILSDEPIAGLDPYHQLQVMEVMRETANNGHAILVVIHDLNMAARFCHRLVVLSEGTIIATGNPSDVLNEETLRSGFHIEGKYLTESGSHIAIPWSRVANNA